MPGNKEVLRKVGSTRGYRSQSEGTPNDQCVKIMIDKERLKNCHILEETEEIRQVYAMRDPGTEKGY